MIQSYAVTAGAPAFLAGPREDTTVYNTSSTVTVYLTDLPSNVNSFALPPGARITWDAGKPLYAFCNANATATVVIIDNGGVIDDPGILAQLIIDKGLAQAIADRISVSPLPGNTARAIQSAGVPTIDAPVVILDSNNQLTGNTPNYYTDQASITSYQSISGHVTITADTQPNTSPAPFMVDLTFSGAGEDLQTVSYCVHGSVNSGELWFQLPALGDLVDVYIIGRDNNTIPLNARVTLVGSYRTLTKPSATIIDPRNKYSDTGALGVGTGPGWQGTLYGDVNGGMIKWVSTSGAGITQNAFPPTRSGRAHISLTVNNTTAGGDITVYVYCALTTGPTLLHKFYVPAGTSSLVAATVADVYIGNGTLWLQTIGRTGLTGTPIVTLDIQFTD